MSNETQETICQWANDTLGRSSTNLSTAERALKEMKELLVGLDENDQDPNAPVEAADVFIVLMRIFEFYGTTWQAEVNKKMAINRARTWIRDGNGHGSHVKTSQTLVDVKDEK